jgi:transcriptional regulator with XRE-family HTH domain/quercetin dioxygenase-like cupin family protein
MPLYSSHLLEYEQLNLGARIREARQRLGLTLKQLAERVESSPARLSQVENERLRLDLQEVIGFADALGVGLDALVPPDVSVPYQIARDAELRTRLPRQTLFSAPEEQTAISSPHTYWPLAELFVGRHLQPMLGRIVPLAESDVRFCYHDEEEFVFVLRGRIEFRLDTPEGPVAETLDRGDSVYFRSDLPHAFRSLDEDAGETLHVFCSPSASTEGGFDWAHHRAMAFEADGGVNPRRQIGDKLRVLREMHGWTIERVARSAGLQPRQMVRIERGDAPIPLDAVMRLARGYGKPLRELIGLAVARPPYYRIQRSGSIPSVPNRRRRTPVERPHAPASKTCQPLAAGFPAREMYPHFLRMLNVAVETLTLHEHHGQEFIYILEGELELTTYTGDQRVREVLHAGDSVYIDSTVPHLLRSWTRNPFSETSAEVIDVFWCPLGEGYLFNDRDD